MSLPLTGRPSTEVLAALDATRNNDLDVTDGHAMAYAFNSGEPAVSALATEAFGRLLNNNALYPDAFPSTPVLENDIVGAAADLLRAGREARGIFTAGGSESIMLAVRAARASRPDIEAPVIVVPETAHAAFHKAAEYLSVGVISVPVDPDTFAASPAAMADAVTSGTVLIVASAYSYAHGVLDPIPEIAAIAAARSIPCHVDACVGGFVLPFLRELGEPIIDFDFAVPGVTSISADIHKYGYAPKGASVVVFRDEEMRRRAHFACSRWTGYTVVNTTVQSSRSAGAVGAAWAVMNTLGHDGYLEIVRRTRQASIEVINHLHSTPRLRVLGKPIANMAAFMSTDEELDIFVLADELKQRGWFTQPQFAFGTSPANLHISLHGATSQLLDEFRTTLADAIEGALRTGPALPDANTMRAVASLKPGDLAPADQRKVLAASGVEGPGALPERMATVNHLLNCAHPAVREQLLLAFFDVLYVPTRAAAPVG